MNRELIILFILSVAFNVSTCVEIKKSPKIAGGTEAARNAFPFQCAIYITKSFLQELSFCSGSIISRNFILSAAHCFRNMQSGFLLAGVHNLVDDDAEYEFDITSTHVVMHENYVAENNLNDIALIDVQSDPFTFLTEAIQPIQLPTKNLDGSEIVGKNSTVAGWGRTSDNSQAISDILMYINAEIIDLAICQKIYGSKVTLKNLCLSGENGRSTCQGDSGGGCTIKTDQNGNRVLVGVVSFGAEAGCQLGYPHVFTFVAPFLDWIETHAGKI